MPSPSKSSDETVSSERSAQRRESLTAASSRRGSRSMESSSGRREISSGRRESSSGRREFERRAVASDEGPTVASGRAGSSSPGKSQEVDERSSNASVRRERSNSSLQKASPREESFLKCNPKEETVDKGSPWEEALPPVPSSGRVSRSIENVLSRCVVVHQITAFHQSSQLIKYHSGPHQRIWLKVVRPPFE